MGILSTIKNYLSPSDIQKSPLDEDASETYVSEEGKLKADLKRLEQREIHNYKLIAAGAAAFFGALFVAAFFIAPPVSILLLVGGLAALSIAVQYNREYFAVKRQDMGKELETLELSEKRSTNTSSILNRLTDSQAHVPVTMPCGYSFSLACSTPPFVQQNINHENNANYAYVPLFFNNLASKICALALDFSTVIENIPSDVNKQFEKIAASLKL